MLNRPPLMSDFVPARREALKTGVAAAAAFGASAWAMPSSAQAKTKIDFMDPKTNLMTLLKLQADTSGKEVISGFPGEAWVWEAGKGNVKVFKTYGIGATRLEDIGNDTFRFYHREVLYYCDPKTGEILNEWTNPITGKKVEVLHILNDPVNRIYKLKGGMMDPPYPHQIVGDRIVFQLDVLRSTEKNPITRAQYPLQSQQDLYQSGELWAISGSVKELSNPKVTSAENHTAWARVGMWLPFMEMGDRQGFMVYHSQSFKFKDGISQIPTAIREHTAKHYPKYLEAPKEWKDLKENENTWSYSLKIMKEKEAAGKRKPDGSIFGV
ncbi:MAG: DUF1838 family protein [Rhodospirillaceae bacterium]|nr:DUF1838 family protein [Rhodospirillaceae bacterium]